MYKGLFLLFLVEYIFNCIKTNKRTSNNKQKLRTKEIKKNLKETILSNNLTRIYWSVKKYLGPVSACSQQLEILYCKKGEEGRRVLHHPSPGGMGENRETGSLSQCKVMTEQMLNSLQAGIIYVAEERMVSRLDPWGQCKAAKGIGGYIQADSLPNCEAASCATWNFGIRPATPGRRPPNTNTGPFLLANKTHQASQVPDGRLQEPLGTVKPAPVGAGASLGLGGSLHNAEFQQPARPDHRPLNTNASPFSLANK
ncbi:hypothetical protein EK904_008196, partial [Melospiza melodia maxima]